MLVVDSGRVPELGEAIRSAEYEPDGDARSRWGTSGNAVLLHIELLRPVPTTFAVHFPLATQGILVESALSAGVVQLKAGKPGSSFKSTFNDRGLMVEVPGVEEFPPWPTIFVRALMEHYRREGMKAIEARQAAEGAYASMTSVARFRLGPSGGT